MPNIELTYGSVESYAARLNKINGLYTAGITQLAKSCDLSSKACQKIWSFSSKETAFSQINSVRKKMITVRDSNSRLGSFVKTIDGKYKSVTAKADSTGDWVASTVRLGIITSILINPIVFTNVAIIWGATTIFSNLSKKKSAKTPATKKTSSGVGTTKKA